MIRYTQINHKLKYLILSICTVTVTSVTITPPNPSGVAGVDDVTLTCIGTLSGHAKARVEWTGQMMRTPPLATVPSTTVSDSLVLTRVRQSYAGTYTCTVTIGASSMTRSVSLAVTGEFVILICEINSCCYTYLAPAIPISIMENQSPVGLRNYTLTCVATPPSSLEVTSPLYRWRRNGQVVSNQINRELNLSPLPLSEDGANYTCQYTASSVYVNNVDVTSRPHTIELARK